MKFPVRIRDILKIEKKNSISISVFGYEKKEKHLIYVSKRRYEEKHVALLLIGEEGKIMELYYNYTSNHGKKYFCRYCLQAFSTEEILKHHIKYCFRINSKQRIIMSIKRDYVKFNNKERKIKSSLMIYADFEVFYCQKIMERKMQKRLI